MMMNSGKIRFCGMNLNSVVSLDLCNKWKRGLRQLRSMQQANHKAPKRGGIKKSFTTSATPLGSQMEATMQMEHMNSNAPMIKMCHFCKGEHAIESCSKLKARSHKKQRTVF